MHEVDVVSSPGFAQVVLWYQRTLDAVAGCGYSTFECGAVLGAGHSPPDYQQGNSFRIMYIHVPASFLAQSIYVSMAVCGVVGLVWKMKIADVALQQSAPIVPGWPLCPCLPVLSG